MINAQSFIEHLRELNYSQYVGVPCSYLKPFINYVIDDDRLDYIGAASEGEAVGIALGAYLAGRKTVVMCQNSGLGNMVNPLTSLNFPFQAPTLVIVTWRGKPGEKDEPQHEQMGQITTRLLDVMDIPWTMFPSDEAEIGSVMAAAEASLARRLRPFALVMPEGAVAPHGLTRKPAPRLVETSIKNLGGGVDATRLTRTAALQEVLTSLRGDEAVVATTGKTGRELYTLADRDAHLYVVGGMGTAAAIGFGIAHSLPSRPVVVIDGDGALLMKMGVLATIGFHGPRNFLHIVLDNEQHDSTGGQATASSVVRFAEVAAATNYRQAVYADDAAGLRAALDRLQERPGPSLLHVKIAPGSPAKLGRPAVQPHEVKQRLMAFLKQPTTSTPTR